MGNAPPLSRTELFNRARQGDVDALAELLQSLRENLRHLARLNGDADLRRKLDTSDILQEIELQAFQDFRSFRGQSIGEPVNWFRRPRRRKSLAW